MWYSRRFHEKIYYVQETFSENETLQLCELACKL